MKKKASCYLCEKVETFEKGEIPWRIVAINIGLNEPYYICNTCDHKQYDAKERQRLINRPKGSKRKKINDVEKIIYREI